MAKIHTFLKLKYVILPLVIVVSHAHKACKNQIDRFMH